MRGLGLLLVVIWGRKIHVSDHRDFMGKGFDIISV